MPTHAGWNMEQKIDLGNLKGIGILYEDDLHDVGQFVLKAYDARWAGTGSKARPALHGLARIYALILNCDSKPFEEAIEALGCRSAQRSMMGITHLTVDSPLPRRGDSRPS